MTDHAEGERQKAADLFPVVYAELRRLAAARMAGRAAGQTLDATSLVHEAYVRLVGREDSPRWNGRDHFFAAAAEAMRHILVDRARRRHALKRGGGAARIDLPEDALAAPDDRTDAELLAVDEALGKLAEADPQAAELVKLRYFAGLSIPDAAAALGMAPRSADRLWAYARAWLRTAIGQVE
ncbi:ECF-type sigma factor [Paludisphaera rhizosphaerae]|uniref:ECF-type sigma factor n=1 Tax=Paludisphaera rhizosphaerae TaxID=2711216 RepID=UPI0013EB0B31|nr:ECF-type sigma factor [Paludisphaera rhizosphaerae]